MLQACCRKHQRRTQALRQNEQTACKPGEQVGDLGVYRDDALCLTAGGELCFWAPTSFGHDHFTTKKGFGATFGRNHRHQQAEILGYAGPFRADLRRVHLVFAQTSDRIGVGSTSQAQLSWVMTSPSSRRVMMSIASAIRSRWVSGSMPSIIASEGKRPGPKPNTR